MMTFRPFSIAQDRDFIADALYDTKNMTDELPEDTVKDAEALIQGVVEVQEIDPRYASLTIEKEYKTGFVFFFPTVNSPQRGYICFEYVVREKRGTGLGKSLMDYAVGILKERGCKEAFLDVSKKNVVAVNFYKKYGFKISGERDDKHYKMRKIF